MLSAKHEKILRDYFDATRGVERLGFILGAGASISSGAPTTARIDTLVADALRSIRFPDEEVGHAFDRLTRSERLDAVAPAFDAVSPCVGYFQLAALARHKKVVVVTLNWDTALERAAEELGISRTYLDHDSPAEVVEAALLADGPGLVVWHIHGSLRTDIRHGTWLTVSLDEEVHQLIERYVLTACCLMVGMSFYDIDVRKAFVRHAERQTDGKLWVCVRGTLRPDYRVDVDRLLESRGCGGNLIVDDALDFDRIVVELNLRQSGYEPMGAPWLRASGIALPAWVDTVLPCASWMRRTVAARAVGLFGEPWLGKSVGAALLSQLWSSLDPEPARVTVTTGAVPALAALQRVLDRAHPLTGLLWLDDVFDGARSDDLQELAASVMELLAEAHSSGTRLMLTGRLADAAQIDLDRLRSAGVTVLNAAPDDWYSASSLEEFARRLGVEPSDPVARKVRLGEIATPAGVASAVGQLPSAVESVSQEAISKDIEAFLRRVPREEQALVARIRLAELSGGFFTWADVYDEAARDRIGRDLDVYLLLHDYEIDGLPCVAIRHDTYRRAVDQVLIRSASGPDRSVPTSVAADELLRRGSEALRIRYSEWRQDSARPEWHASLAPSIVRDLQADDRKLVSALSPDLFDEWSLLPVVFELAARWSDLRHSTVVQDFSRSVLNSTEMLGCYAFVEALMYLRDGVAGELVDLTAAAVMVRLDNPGAHVRELALILDSMLVGHPDYERFCAGDVASAMLDLPAHAGALGHLAFMWTYHSEGLRPEQVGGARYSPFERIGQFGQMDRQEFAWMMKWHFVHQAQNRALGNRHRVTDWRYISADPDKGLELEEHRASKVRLMARQLGMDRSLVGWGFHFLCNMYRVHGSFDLDELPAELLADAPPNDEGVLTAALTYEAPAGARAKLRGYLSRSDSWARLIDIADSGVVLGAWEVRHPNFHFARSTSVVRRELSPTM